MRTPQLVIAMAFLIPGSLMAQDDTRKPGAERQERVEERKDPTQERVGERKDPRQEAADKELYGIVEQRVKLYVDALDLTEEQALEMSRNFMQEERELAPMRQECANLQSKMQTQMDGYSQKTQAILTPEQQNKLNEMRSAGRINDDVNTCGVDPEQAKKTEERRKEAIEKTERQRKEAQQKTEAPAKPGMESAPSKPAAPRR